MTLRHLRPVDKDLVDVLLDDHAELGELFARWLAPGLDPAERRALSDVFIAELVRHSVAEEEYLYPTVRDVLVDGDALADRELADHAEAERLMKRLESLDPADPAYDQVGRELVDLVTAHVRDEEETLFPALRVACRTPALRRLAGMAEMAKTSAPTRAHPAAPTSPPWNTLLAPGLGLVDRVRDALHRRPTHFSDI